MEASERDRLMTLKLLHPATRLETMAFISSYQVASVGIFGYIRNLLA